MTRITLGSDSKNIIKDNDLLFMWTDDTLSKTVDASMMTGIWKPIKKRLWDGNGTNARTIATINQQMISLASPGSLQGLIQIIAAAESINPGEKDKMKSKKEPVIAMF